LGATWCALSGWKVTHHGPSGRSSFVRKNRVLGRIGGRPLGAQKRTAFGLMHESLWSVGRCHAFQARRGDSWRAGVSGARVRLTADGSVDAFFL
jgi:hypothetical protein